MNKISIYFLGLASLLALLPSMHGQAVYTATRSARIEAGVGGMYLNNDYSERSNYGLSAWGDYDFSRYFGAEIEAHFGGIISPDDIGENSYMVGPRISYHKRKAQIYGKLMFGRGTISNQLFNTSSTFNLYAFGGGVEYRLTRKFNARLDFEEQKWPDFEPHTLSPLTASIGVMYIIR